MNAPSFGARRRLLALWGRVSLSANLAGEKLDRLLARGGLATTRDLNQLDQQFREQNVMHNVDDIGHLDAECLRRLGIGVARLQQIENTITVVLGKVRAVQKGILKSRSLLVGARLVVCQARAWRIGPAANDAIGTTVKRALL